MAKGTNQKLKLSYLTQIMLAKTDEDHSLTMSQIMEELERRGVTAERKSIYSDFQDMTDKLGIEVIKEQIGRETYYRVASREFELAEVKLLIDAIQSSKFITQKKSRELINKIKGLVSVYQASQLQRQVVIADRVKTMNETVYYNVDDLYTAINTNCKIQFKYYKWDINKKLIPRHNDEFFEVSPWALTWDDENYYLIAYDEWDQKIKNYRVDKMMHLSMLDEKRAGKEAFKNFDITVFSKTRFGMYNGETKKVRIELPNYLCGVFIDRFGEKITFHKIDEERSSLNVDVAVSYQFFGWIFALGKDVKVTGSDDVVEQMKKAANEFVDNYK